jgi:hypothetical protein
MPEDLEEERDGNAQEEKQTLRGYVADEESLEVLRDIADIRWHGCSAGQLRRHVAST